MAGKRAAFSFAFINFVQQRVTRTKIFNASHVLCTNVGGNGNWKMAELISSMNWKLIIVYLIATSFLIIGLSQFSFLTDIELTELIAKKESIRDLENAGDRLTLLLIWTAVLSMVGLIISGLIMFQLTRKVKYFWINILIVLLLGHLATRFELLYANPIKDVTLFLGGLFSQLGPFYPFVINGVFLTGLGLLIFYNKWTDRLILRVQ